MNKQSKFYLSLIERRDFVKTEIEKEIKGVGDHCALCELEGILNEIEEIINDYLNS